MKRNTMALVFFLVSFMTLFPLLGKTYRFELPKTTALNGVDLRAGTYELKLNSTQTKAQIYKNGKLAVTAQTEVTPLGISTRNTILIGKYGTLSEYRSRHETIRFIDASPPAVLSKSAK